MKQLNLFTITSLAVMLHFSAFGQEMQNPKELTQTTAVPTTSNQKFSKLLSLWAGIWPYYFGAEHFAVNDFSNGFEIWVIGDGEEVFKYERCSYSKWNFQDFGTNDYKPHGIACANGCVYVSQVRTNSNGGHVSVRQPITPVNPDSKFEHWMNFVFTQPRAIATTTWQTSPAQYDNRQAAFVADDHGNIFEEDANLFLHGYRIASGIEGLTSIAATDKGKTVYFVSSSKNTVGRVVKKIEWITTYEVTNDFIKIENPQAVAVDKGGNIYVLKCDHDKGAMIIKYNASGEQVSDIDCSFTSPDIKILDMCICRDHLFVLTLDNNTGNAIWFMDL